MCVRNLDRFRSLLFVLIITVVCAAFFTGCAVKKEGVADVTYNDDDDDCGPASDDQPGLSWLYMYPEDSIYNISAAGNGGVFITGVNEGDILFDGEATDPQLDPGATFIAKYRPDGFDWVKAAITLDDFYPSIDSDIRVGYGITGISVDSSGEFSAVGYLTREKGVGIFGNISSFDLSLSHRSSEDGFISRYDENGELAWVRRIDRAVPDFVATTEDGSSIILGGFSYSSPTSDPDVLFYSTGTEPVSFSRENGELFVAKYDADGEFLWAKSILTGCNASNFITDLKAWDDGSFVFAGAAQPYMFIVGCFNPTPGPGVIFLYSYYPFIARFNEDGSLAWQAAYEGRFQSYPVLETIDDGSLLLAGATFNGALLSSTNNELLAIGGDDVNYRSFDQYLFSAKYDKAGVAKWVKTIKTEDSRINAITKLPNGDFAITGFLVESALLGAGEPNEIVISNLNHDGDFFIARFTSDGSLIYVRTVNWSSWSSGLALVSDSDGSLYALGMADGSFEIGSDYFSTWVEPEMFLAHFRP